MVFVMSICVIIYISIVMYSAKQFVAHVQFNADQELEVLDKQLGALAKKRDDLFQEKMAAQEEAIRIFTLYEITREITKSLNEKVAFETFERKLVEHINFEECRLLDADSKEVKGLKKDKDYFVFTLKGKGRRIGYLVLKGVSDEDREKVVILGQQFALALRRVKLYRAIERIAITDSLTDVNTRRYTMERLNEEIKRSELRKMPMSFLMLDVDFFKSFNDKYGHLAGDKILHEIGKIIKENIREIDIAGRYGGEEFCVVLPDTDSEGAQYAAERIRVAAEKTIIKAYDATVTATLSIGIATFPKDGKSSEEIIDKADWTLYRAKKQGRNRVCAYGIYQ